MPGFDRWTRRAAAMLVALCALAGATSCTRHSENPAASPANPPPGSTGAAGSSTATTPASAVPRPDHLVVVVEENHGFADIIDNTDAPYLNSVAREGALFTASSAVTHPSQPNYVALFSGSTQGVTDDSCPQTFDTGNLGAQLAGVGAGFAGYAEDLPAAGYRGCARGDYARKHSPWTNFPSVPAAQNLPFSAFPHDYATLPAVSFVIPNLANDMHDGTIARADSWLRANLDGYRKWAMTHNSLLIVTWDEDDNSSADNRIATIFSGARVSPGRYAEPIDHYTVLHTIEAAYGLPPLGEAARTAPITDVWTAR